MAPLWEIRLLGGVSIRSGEYCISRFRTHKTALLLARLAHASPAKLSREQLAEQLWPESDPETARSILRSMLSSLRRQLEPPGVPVGSVLATNRVHIALNAAAIVVDAHEFERQALAAIACKTPELRIQLLEQAAAVYGGELLPGYYDDWILWERDRLQRLHQDIICGLAVILQERGDREQALHHALHAVSLEPLAEEAHARVIQLYLDDGRVEDARQQYDRLADLLWTEMELRPSTEITALVADSRPVVLDPGAPADPGLPEIPAEWAPPAADPDACHPTRAVRAESQTIGLEWLRGRPVFQPDQFFGREEELLRLERLLDLPIDRLLTIIGPGGVGKTRLAIELAGRLAAARAMPYWFVSLADLSDVHLLMDEIVRVLQIRPVFGATPFEEIAIALSGRPALLVLDNFERLVDGGAAAVADLIAAVPELICVVTSRQALEIAAEQVYRLEPLPVPSGPEPPERLVQYAAVQLFVNRARRVVADFQVTDRNAGAIGALVAQVEGLPLSIELAAGWVQTLTPAAMLQRLGSRFDFLVSRRRDVPARYRSLRASLDHSYDLLSPELRRLLGQLSVFRGGFTVEAVGEICPDGDAGDRLRQLQTASILSIREQEEGMRFGMLEALRDYAAAQTSAEDQEELRQRHAEWALRLAQRAEKELVGPEQVRWAAQLDDDYENIRTALEWTLSRDPAAALSLAGSLWRYWHRRGLLREASRWLKQALAGCSAPEPDLQATALNAAGIFAAALGDTADACRYYEQSLLVSRDLGDQRRIANALCNLASILVNQKAFARAAALFMEALDAYRAANHAPGVTLVTANLGVLELERQNYDAAKSLLEECALLNREVGNLLSEAFALHNLGEALRREGNHKGARARYTGALRLFLELGERHNIARSVRGLAAIHFEESDSHTAAMLFCLADEIRQNAGTKFLPGDDQELDAQSARLQPLLGEEEREICRARARTLELSALIAPASPTQHILRANI